MILLVFLKAMSGKTFTRTRMTLGIEFLPVIVQNDVTGSSSGRAPFLLCFSTVLLIFVAVMFRDRKLPPAFSTANASLWFRATLTGGRAADRACAGLGSLP